MASICSSCISIILLLFSRRRRFCAPLLSFSGFLYHTKISTLITSCSTLGGKGLSPKQLGSVRFGSVVRILMNQKLIKGSCAPVRF
ncbi:hypothetical protein Pfo_006563, partial [Paulownia fortunei]